MRYRPYIALALVGWALAIAGMAVLDSAALFGGVAVTTLAVVLGFVKLERGVGDTGHSNAPGSARARRSRRRTA